MSPAPRSTLLALVLVLGGVIACPPWKRADKATGGAPAGQTQPAPPPAPEVTPQSPAAEPEATRGQMTRARALISVLRDRPLDVEQREQVDAGAAFIEQAEAALGNGDLDRAAVLADKALALLEKIDRDTRPERGLARAGAGRPARRDPDGILTPAPGPLDPDRRRGRAPAPALTPGAAGASATPWTGPGTEYDLRNATGVVESTGPGSAMWQPCASA